MRYRSRSVVVAILLALSLAGTAEATSQKRSACRELLANAEAFKKVCDSKESICKEGLDKIIAAAAEACSKKR